MTNRFYQMMVVCLAVFALSACGDDDSKSNNANNANNMNNVNNSNNLNNGNNSNNVNNSNNINNEPTQCTQTGEDCTPGDATDPNFVCEDAGEGPKCYAACTPPADGQQYPCPSTQVCISATQGGPTFCIPSQCDGFLDSAACDSIATANPGAFPNGAACFPSQNNGNLCFPAGTAAVGEDCMNIDDCAAGLLCFGGTCNTLCSDDAGCDTAGGERCIGGDDDDFIDTGVGVCEVGCDSYGAAGQCPQGQGCLPITEDDGICDDVGAGTAYEDCDTMATTNPCGEGMRCLGYTEGTAKCTPFCNPTATDPAATCPAAGNNLGSYCFDLTGGDDPGIRDGACLEECQVADYGQGNCAGGFVCQPFRGERHVCFPGGTVAAGGACDPEATDCAEGTYCRAFGDGTGICVSRCEVMNGTNNTLACEAGETCQPVGDDTFNFGRCGIECTPNNSADASCPANLQNCIADDDDMTASYCEASGMTAVGQACESPAAPNACVAGSSCVNGVNFGLAGSDALTMAGTCNSFCDPFDNASCPAGQACSVDIFVLSLSTGSCFDAGTNTAPTEVFGACPEIGKACGNRGICLNDNGSGICQQYCDPDSTDAGNCPANARCATSFNNNGTVIDLSTGPYGLCIPSN